MKCVHCLRDFFLISLSKHATIQQRNGKVKQAYKVIQRRWNSSKVSKHLLQQLEELVESLPSPWKGKLQKRAKPTFIYQYSIVKPEDRRILEKEKMLLPLFQVLKCGSVQLHPNCQKRRKNEMWLWLAYFLHKVPIKAGREMPAVDGVQAAVFLHRQAQLGRNC